MAQHSAILGPLQLTYIQGFGAAMNVEPFLETGDPIELSPLVLSTLLQAGLDRVEVLTDTLLKDVQDPWLRERIEVDHSADWVRAFMIVNELFAPYRDRVSEEANRGLGDLESFLIDFIYAVHRRRDMIVAMRFPSVEQLKGVLPARILTPIRHLLSSCSVTKSNLVLPRVSIALRDAAVFQGIMLSSEFSSYCTAHSNFGTSTESVEVAKASIEDAASVLRNQNARVLFKRRTPLTLLDFSAKFIDVVVGGLPGKLANMLSDGAVHWVQNERRLVIYQLNQALSEMMQARAAEVFAGSLERDR